jgi:hypothetical protein
MHHKNLDPYDPRITEFIGMEETTVLARGLLNILLETYFPLWESTCEPFEEFVSWTPPIEERVIARLRSLWDGRGDWFDRVALPRVKAGINRCRAYTNVRVTSRKVAVIIQHFPHTG